MLYQAGVQTFEKRTSSFEIRAVTNSQPLRTQSRSSLLIAEERDDEKKIPAEALSTEMIEVDEEANDGIIFSLDEGHG